MFACEYVEGDSPFSEEERARAKELELNYEWEIFDYDPKTKMVRTIHNKRVNGVLHQEFGEWFHPSESMLLTK